MVLGGGGEAGVLFVLKLYRITGERAMIKVVSRSFLGKEKYRDFQLCYVDSIPETVYEQTPESKAWERTAEYRAIKKRLEAEVKQGLRNSIYDWDSPLIRNTHYYDAPNPRYRKGKAELYAFFTEVALSDQWGDDWDDTPYEHNAGEPYDYHYEGDERKEHLIVKVPFYIRRDGFYVKLPRDYAYDNSPFCVRDINAGAVAWIFARGWERKSIDGLAIQAGANPYEFFELVDQINEMYPYEPEEDDE